jgi:hypothetical protein
MAHLDDDTERDLDAPTPPGGPLRQDAPSGNVNPAPVPADPGDDPQTPRPSTTHPDDLEPQSPSDAERGEAEGPGEASQLENAETSLDEPSDGSGGE